MIRTIDFSNLFLRSLHQESASNGLLTQSVIEVLLAQRSLCRILPTPSRLAVADKFPCPEDLRVDNDYAAANSEKDTESLYSRD